MLSSHAVRREVLCGLCIVSGRPGCLTPLPPRGSSWSREHSWACAVSQQPEGLSADSMTTELRGGRSHWNSSYRDWKSQVLGGLRRLVGRERLWASAPQDQGRPGPPLGACPAHSQDCSLSSCGRTDPCRLWDDIERLSHKHRLLLPLGEVRFSLNGRHPSNDGKTNGGQVL